MITEKTCNTCFVLKPLDQFNRKKSGLHGRMPDCSDCRNFARRAGYVSEMKVAADRRRKAADGVKFKSQVMCISAKQRAIKRGVPYTITPDYIQSLCQTHCPVLGIPLDYQSDHLHHNSPSIDCFVPSEGYVQGNVAVVSHHANNIKCDATPSEIMQVALWCLRTSVGDDD